MDAGHLLVHGAREQREGHTHLEIGKFSTRLTLILYGSKKPKVICVNMALYWMTLLCGPSLVLEFVVPAVLNFGILVVLRVVR